MRTQARAIESGNRAYAQAQSAGLGGAVALQRAIGAAEAAEAASATSERPTCPDCGGELRAPECEAEFCPACYWCADHGSECDDLMAHIGAHVKGEH